MRLTKAERKWIDDVQALLSACPSKRLGFYTIGDPDVILYDLTKEAKIEAVMDENDRFDFGSAVEKAGAALHEYLVFPACVHSTSG